LRVAEDHYGNADGDEVTLAEVRLAYPGMSRDEFMASHRRTAPAASIIRARNREVDRGVGRASRNGDLEERSGASSPRSTHRSRK
jgi:hypothetical protein